MGQRSMKKPDKAGPVDGRFAQCSRLQTTNALIVRFLTFRG